MSEQNKRVQHIREFGMRTNENDNSIAESDKHISDIKSEDDKLHNEYVTFLENQRKQDLLFIMQQKSHINDLREALEKIHSDTSVDSWQNKLAEQALSKTPAQSLIEHNNEVIEICAKVADNMPLNDSEFHEYRSSDDSKAMAWDIAFAIRALKEVK